MGNFIVVLDKIGDIIQLCIVELQQHFIGQLVLFLFILGLAVSCIRAFRGD